MLPIIQENQLLTMSSREISELTSSRHDSVKRSMERMEGDNIIKLTPSVEVNHKGQKVTVYLVSQRDSYIVVAQLSPQFTAALVDRWQELEITIQQQDPALVLAHRVIEQAAKIEHLEKTKAQINDKRTATIMGKLGNAAKTIKKLEDKLQDVGQYLSLTASKIPARVDTELKNNVQSWRLLKQLSSDMQLTPKKVKCERYGEVLAYHVDVIERFKAKYL